MPGLKGDYLGFSIGEYVNGNMILHHSSDFGITQISTGNRYNDRLSPETENKLVRVPNGNGSYYFGSTYTQRQFQISFVFDNMSESQRSLLKSMALKDKKLCLIFDEEPYKVWNVVLNSVPYLKFIAFDINEPTATYYHTTDLLPNSGTTSYPTFPQGKIYKGEGELNFIAYYPFAKDRYKFINYYSVTNIPEWKYDENDTTGVYTNKEEWQTTSGIINYVQKNTSDQTIRIDNPSAFQEMYVYNGGDIDTPLKILYAIANVSYGSGGTQSNVTITLTKDSTTLKTLVFSTISTSEINAGTNYLCINANNGLIEGYSDTNTPTGQTFNQHIVSGVPIKLHPMRDELDPTSNNQYIMHYKLNSTVNWYQVKYNYWYC